jgi:hypothetical protein
MDKKYDLSLSVTQQKGSQKERESWSIKVSLSVTQQKGAQKERESLRIKQSW